MTTTIDPEMRELLNLMARAVVPRSKRRAVVRENCHSAYYSPNRYRYI